ncbi:efflux RND transporter permease subunit [Echinicola sediminis]
MSPFRIVISFFVLAIIGFALVPRLTVELNPREKQPVLRVSFGVRDASPELVEKLGTAPLEGLFSQLADLKKIESVSRYNGGSVTLRFDKHTDMEFKKFEVASLVRQVYPSLDPTVSYPLIYQSSQSNNEPPILQYSVNAPFAPFEIKKVTEDVLKSVLNRFDEVEEIQVYGANELQLYVTYDIQKMQAYGVNRGMLTGMLRSAIGSSYPGMALNHQGESLFIQVDRSLTDREQLENLRITTKAGKDIYLRDIAQLTLEEAEPSQYYRINGNNSVTMSITSRPGVNKVVLAQKLKQAMTEASELLPRGYDVRLEQDDTEYLSKELHKIYKRSGLSLLILVVFIFLINRNWRYLSVLFLGILVNLSVTGIILYSLGTHLHLYSIAGLTISFGLIVDNAIIMIDHLHKHRNRKAFLALLAASLTTIAALLMVFLLPEDDQRNLTDFAVVVAVMLAVSLLVALLFTPAMYQLLFEEKARSGRSLSVKKLRSRVRWFGRYRQGIGFTARYRKTFVTLLVLLFGLPVFYLPAKWEGQEWYNKVIGSTLYQEDVRPYVDKALGGSLRMFVRGVFEKSGYREASQTRLYVNLRLPFGNTLDQMDFIIREFEEFLKGVEGVDKFVSNVSSGQHASIAITFKEAYENSALPYQLKGRLSVKATDWSGANWSIYGVGQGFHAGPGGDGIPSFTVMMKGYNFDELERQSEVLAKKLLKHKRIQEVNTNERMGYNEKSSEEFVLRFDQEQMALQRTNQYEVISALQDLAKPTGAGLSVALKDKSYGVVVREEGAEDFSRFDLEHTTLIGGGNRLFKVSGLGSLQKETTVNSLHKEDRQYIRRVAFEYMGSRKFGNEYLEEVLEEMRTSMPIGYSAATSSYYWNYDKNKRQYTLLLVLILAIFFICGILFENLKQPFYIIAVIPIAFIGLFLIFSVFDFYFDQGGYAAFVMLGGLAVNAAIFIVNDLNNRGNGLYNRNVLKSVAGKAIPILLTVLSTCFGLIPFVMEGQNEVFWFSLAIGTIGGLVFSMVGVFWALPVFLWKKESSK